MSGFKAPNWTQVPNDLLDSLLPQIDTVAELKVALVIVRATTGWHEERAVLSLSELQRRTGLGRSAVVAGLRAAHERGYVDKVPAGQGFSFGLVVDGQVVRGTDQLEGSDERTTASPTSGPLASPTSGPHIKKGGKNRSARDRNAAGGDGHPWPTTVDRKPVTDAEGALALAVLDGWNAAAEQSLRAKSYLGKIVMRAREHPELTVEEHVAVIRNVLTGRRWWSGTPDPRIVYGSDDQFESCLVAWRARSNGGSPPRSGVQSGRTDVQTHEPEVRGDLDHLIRY